MKYTQTDTETNPKIKAGDTCWPCCFQTHRTQAQFVKKEIQDRKIQKTQNMQSDNPQGRTGGNCWFQS